MSDTEFENNSIFSKTSRSEELETTEQERVKKLKQELNTKFDNKTFKSNYKFVNDIRQNEKEQLKKEFEMCTNPERKKTIKLIMQRIDNQIREQQKKEMENRKEYNEKISIREKLRKGEKPVFKKKCKGSSIIM
ncbi:hypothetical protein NQ314_003494 [Rhamnusium bicolor]|uniref:rRNA biogenesis protein RRP36 n=1 Tax=Rhamnusium bicolor TaxID=1586634 RepID=A0AAV8ZN18_9CUCU|nr:hypothetical protein NQ314_003494 [Rhamnusium bicolor]